MLNSCQRWIWNCGRDQTDVQMADRWRTRPTLLRWVLLHFCGLFRRAEMLSDVSEIFQCISTTYCHQLLLIIEMNFVTFQINQLFRLYVFGNLIYLEYLKFMMRWWVWDRKQSSFYVVWSMRSGHLYVHDTVNNISYIHYKLNIQVCAIQRF